MGRLVQNLEGLVDWAVCTADEPGAQRSLGRFRGTELHQWIIGTLEACPNLIKVDVTFETVGSRMILNALNISAKTLKNVRVCNSRTTRSGKVLNLCGGIPVFALLQRLDYLDQLEVEDGRGMIAEDVVYAKKHPCDIYPAATESHLAQAQASILIPLGSLPLDLFVLPASSLLLTPIFTALGLV